MTPKLMLLAALALGLAVAPAMARAGEPCLIARKECEALFKPRNAKLLAAMRADDAEIAKMSEAQLIKVAMLLVGFYDKFEALQAQADARCGAGQARPSFKGFDKFYVTGEGQYKRALMLRGKSDCAWIKVK